MTNLLMFSVTDFLIFSLAFLGVFSVTFLFVLSVTFLLIFSFTLFFSSGTLELTQSWEPGQYGTLFLACSPPQCPTQCCTSVHTQWCTFLHKKSLHVVPSLYHISVWVHPSTSLPRLYYRKEHHSRRSQSETRVPIPSCCLK